MPDRYVTDGHVDPNGEPNPSLVPAPRPLTAQDDILERASVQMAVAGWAADAVLDAIRDNTQEHA